MIRTQVYIPDRLYHLAKLHAEREGVSISEFMRQGLEIKLKAKTALRKNGKKQKGVFDDLVGKYHLKGRGVTNIALTHNDIYDL